MKRVFSISIFCVLVSGQGFGQIPKRVDSRVNMAAPSWVNMQVDLSRANQVMPDGSISHHNPLRPLSPLEQRYSMSGNLQYHGNVTFGPSRFSTPIWHTQGKLFINGYDSPRPLPHRWSADLTVYGRAWTPQDTMAMTSRHRGGSGWNEGPWAPRRDSVPSMPPMTFQTPALISRQSPLTQSRATGSNASVFTARPAPAAMSPGSLSPSSVTANVGIPRSSIVGASPRSEIRGSSKAEDPQKLSGVRTQKQIHPDRQAWNKIMVNFDKGLSAEGLKEVQALAVKYFEWSEPRYVLAVESQRSGESWGQQFIHWAEFLRTCSNHPDALVELMKIPLSEREGDEWIEKLRAVQKQSSKWTDGLDAQWKIFLIRSKFDRQEEATSALRVLERFESRHPSEARQLKNSPHLTSNALYWKIKRYRESGSVPGVRLSPACEPLE